MHTQTECLPEYPLADALRSTKPGIHVTDAGPIEAVRTDHMLQWRIPRDLYDAHKSVVERSGVSFVVVDDLWT